MGEDIKECFGIHIISEFWTYLLQSNNEKKSRLRKYHDEKANGLEKQVNHESNASREKGGSSKDYAHNEKNTTCHLE
jgi:hypothetical protein